MEPNLRRSGRRRQANKQYQDYIRERDSLRLLRVSSESSRPSSPDNSGAKRVRVDNDFDISKANQNDLPGEEEEDDVSVESGSVGAMSEASSVGLAADDDDGPSLIPALDVSEPKEPIRTSTQSADAELHSRGLHSTHKYSGKQYLWTSLVGPAKEDSNTLLFARDRWKFARDVTFPSRKSLAEITKQDPYFILSNLGIPADDLRQEATQGWDWYYDQVGTQFKAQQRLQRIHNREAQKHIALTTGRTGRIIMGPNEKQVAYSLRHLEPMDFGTAWESGETSVDTSPPTSTRYRDGWLINAGAKIQCLAWASNLNDTDVQYLALSTSCSSAQRETAAPSEDKRAPAFRPSAPYPSSIQIWAVSCGTTSDGLRSLKMGTKPVLTQLLCTDWGNIRQLQWCPVWREARDERDIGESSSKLKNLGLLGVLASDGHVRVLDISASISMQSDTDYRYVQSSAFDAFSQLSLYTCFAFVSSTDILCGTAGGALELFHLLPSEDSSSETSGPPNPIPYLTTQQSPTYIQWVSPAYPSVFPNLVASMSMTGTPVLTDLRSPLIDRSIGKCARLASKLLIYCQQLRCYISTSEGDDIFAYPVRRFFSGIRVGRYPEHGILTALAVSPWHPCLLMGTAGGTVSATNLVRSIVPSTKRVGGRECWVQKLCEYHWRPDTEQDASSSSEPFDQRDETIDSTTANRDIHREQKGPTRSTTSSKPHSTFYGPDPRPGVSRFHDGFLAQKQGPGSTTQNKDKTNTNAKAKTKPKSKSKPKPTTTKETRATSPTVEAQAQAQAQEEEVKKRSGGGGGGRKLATALRGTETIYEEEQAVSCLAWNPNLTCAGILAVGWASGLLRIEDVAV